MYAELSVIIDGALDEDATFYDETLLSAWLDGLQEDANSDGYTREVYRVDHEHDYSDECECVQYLTDHHPYRTIVPNPKPEPDGYCCTDCLAYLVNGTVPDEHMSETELAAWLDKVHSHTGGLWVMADFDDEGSFSWSSCDVCKSHLGGTRYGLLWVDL